jgi:hypothetical protein
MKREGREKEKRDKRGWYPEREASRYEGRGSELPIS